MAKHLRFRNLLFPQPSKPFVSSSSSSLSSSDVNSSSHCSSFKTRALLNLLDSCKTSTHLSQIQAHLTTSGLLQHPSFCGRLLKLSSSLLSNDFHYTYLVFKSVNFPDAFCVNTVIKSYSCSEHYKEAVFFYVEMLESCDFYPNSFTFPPLISACAKLNCWDLGRMCHGHVLKYGVDSVLPVQNSLVHLYACCGRMDVAWNVFEEMLERDLVSWNTVIDGFVKAGDIGLAHKLFDDMPDRNVVSWNVMMTGYLNLGNPGNVMKLFREMMARGFGSNGTTAVNVIAACGRSNNLKEGRSVHGFLVKTFHSFSLILGTAVVDMYSRCGRVDVAREIFDSMPCRNLVSWNTMILGHCIHGNPIDGLSLYSEMVGTSKQRDDSDVCKDLKLDEGSTRVLPDEVTFIGILCACARKGMLAEGRSYFSEMIDVFKVKPNFAHYWCMANLMANADLVQEAVDILKNIPTDEDASPETSLWAGLFASCRFQGDMMLGEQIAKDLIEQDPQNFSYYDLLVNIYAVAGRWGQVAKTKDVMKGRGIKRVPCCTLKDLTEIVRNVKVGDKLQKDLQMAFM